MNADPVLWALGLATLLNASLALLFVRRGGGGARLPHAALAAAIALWTGTFVAIALRDETPWLVLWSRLSFVAGCGMGASLVALAHAFPYAGGRRSLIAAWVLAAPGVLFAALVPTELIVVSAVRDGAIVRVAYGPVHGALVLWTLACVVATVASLIWKYRLSSYDQRLRIRYVIVGVTSFAAVAVTTNAVLPALGFRGMNRVGPLASLAFLVPVTYAVARHRVADIDVLFRRGLVYSTLVGATSVVLVAALMLVQSRLADRSGAMLATLFCATAIVVLFGPARRLLDRATDRIFFRAGSDPSEAVRAVAERLSTSAHSGDGLNGALSELKERLHAETARVFSRRAGSGDFVAAWGDAALPGDGRIAASGELCRALFESGASVTRDECEARARQQDSSEARSIAESLASRGAEVALALRHGDGRPGILLLGPKRDGAAYRHAELDLAETVASQIAVALENRSLVEGMLLNERFAAAGQVASSVAHDIRNPLQSLAGMLDELAKVKDDPSRWPRVDELRKRFSESAEHVTRLASNLTDLARPQAPQFEPHQPADLVEFALGLQENDLAKANIRVVRELDRSLVVRADRGQISQALLNLVINARQAMPSGGTLTVSARPASEGARPFVSIRVADTGTGIAREDLSRVFRTSFTTKAGGTGLGLASVHRIVTEHGGTIGVESEIGKGTTFDIRIPRALPRGEGGAS